MKYSAHIISKCNWASPGVGFSDASIDYPFIPKPGSVIYDYIDLRKPTGRDPGTGLPLWIDEPNTARRIQEVEEEGIGSMGSDVVPTFEGPIDASLCNIKISDDASIDDIDEDARFLIWGLASLLDPPTLPVGKEDWEASLPVSVDRMLEFNSFMELRGVDPQFLADYWLAHPAATYLSVVEDFGLFIV